MSYRHGVYISEVPTSILPPVTATAGLPVVFGIAPVNMTADPAANVNKPVLCYSYREAVEAFGFVDADPSTGLFTYNISEFIKSHFALFAAAPVVIVNVLDPSEHVTSTSDQTLAVTAGVVNLPSGTLPASVVVVDGLDTLVEGTDYDLTILPNGGVRITAIPDSDMPITGNVDVSYDAIDPSAVDSDDIIGGIDVSTGAASGLELLNEVFPRFRLVPGQVLAPGYSSAPAVAAVMDAKASNINGHFKAIALIDVPTGTATKYTDVPAWKNNNNITGEQQVVFWPMVQLGDDIYHMSTQAAGVISRTDAENQDVPYKSPSNENLQSTGTVLADGTEVMMGPDTGAFLNGQGIVTGLNFIGGWKLWGNRTGIYPGETDPKDAFIAIRRMFNWIGNTLVLSYWQRVDNPLNRRQIDTVVDSNNIFLNGLTSRGFIIGGRVEFLPDENPITDLADGIARFHVYVTPPSPNRELDFILEYDPGYLSGLFE